MADKINQKLTAAFQPAVLKIRDDSHQHAGHAGAKPGGETHFHVTIKSEKLIGLNRVQQHRTIMAALKEEFAAGVHALQIEVLN